MAPIHTSSKVHLRLLRKQKAIVKQTVCPRDPLVAAKRHVVERPSGKWRPWRIPTAPVMINQSMLRRFDIGAIQRDDHRLQLEGSEEDGIRQLEHRLESRSARAKPAQAPVTGKGNLGN